MSSDIPTQPLLVWTSHPINEWDELMSLFSSKLQGRSFIFRGQAICEDSLWKFQTRLERACLQVSEGPLEEAKESLRTVLKVGLQKQPIGKIECGLIREFQRKSSLYLQQKPNDSLEWLALMRHYGAPTRLLDWTYSLFVALFFSLEASELRKPAAVWALDTDWLRICMQKVEIRENEGDSNLWDLLNDDPHLQKSKTWEKYFSGSYDFVIPVNPFTLNERLVIQQGLFLCPGNISIPFQDNLAKLQQNELTSTNALIKIELHLSTAEKNRFLQHLYRMNISRANLFPGLQGFAESLATRLIFPEVLVTQSPL